MTYNKLLTEWNKNLPPRRKFQIAEQIILFSVNLQELTSNEQKTIEEARLSLLKAE